MKVRLRPATMADAPALVHLLQALGYPGTEAFIAERLRQLASHPDGLVQVAEVEQVVLGFISLHFIPPATSAA
jgi:predicted N-acetyltransferase YhbS